MRPGLVATAATASLCLLLAGCGSSGASNALATTSAKPAPVRTAYAESLAKLCTARRRALEKVGQATSPDLLVVKLPRQNAVLGGFLDKVRALEPPPAQKKAAADFARFYATYLDGQIYAVKAVKASAYDGYFQVVDSSLYWQKQAEKVALRLRAPECAVRPTFPR